MGILKRKQSIYLALELLRKPLHKLFLIRRKVKFGKNITIFGKPIVINKGSINIGSNIKLISSSKFYGEGIFPVSLYAINEKSKIEIGDNCVIQGTSIRCNEEIKIGNNVVFAGNCKLIDHDHHIDLEKRNLSNYPSKPIMIEDYVLFGYNVTVLKGVKIGKGAIIGAGSVVTNDIPEMCIAAGNPAKVIKKNNKI